MWCLLFADLVDGLRAPQFFASQSVGVLLLLAVIPLLPKVPKVGFVRDGLHPCTECIELTVILIQVPMSGHI